VSLTIDCFPTRDGYREMLGTPQLYQQLHALQQKYPDWDIFLKMASCTLCGRRFPVKRRYRKISYKHANYCPKCKKEKVREWSKEWYRRNRDAVVERKREYRRKHPERVRLAKMMYRLRKWIVKQLPGVWRDE